MKPYSIPMRPLSTVRQVFDAVYRRTIPISLRLFIRQRVQHLYGYKTLSDPFKLIDVDPKEIQYRSQTRFLPESQHLGRIVGGDWDKNIERIDQTPTYTGLKQRFEEGRPWTQTDYYRYAEKQIDSTGDFLGYSDSEAFLENRCKYVDELFRSIQDCFQVDSSNNPVDQQRPWSAYDPTGVSIVIGRNGRMILHDGTHRVTIAQIVGLESIPVHVLVRHKQWQKTRENHPSQRKTGNETHPDLKDISLE